MRSSSLWKRRFIRAAAVSTFRNGSNSNNKVPLLAALAHQHSSSFDSSYRRHARLFATSVPITTMDENNAASENDKFTDYEKWVRRLYMTNMFHPVKMGLTNMRKLHNLMGNPMDDVRSVP
jgi:dihydrofolate synthase/folylpolyglutamate synthase